MKPVSIQIRKIIRSCGHLAVGAGFSCLLTGCYSSFNQIDDKVAALLDDSTGSARGDAVPAPQGWPDSQLSNGTMDTPDPPTFNPSGTSLEYESDPNDSIDGGSVFIDFLCGSCCWFDPNGACNLIDCSPDCSPDCDPGCGTGC